jgi:hypothetical protein
MKLDRTRSFALIYGSNIAKFEQDGVEFDKNGDALTVVPPTPKTHSEKMKASWARRKSGLAR